MSATLWGSNQEPLQKMSLGYSTSVRASSPHRMKHWESWNRLSLCY
uniref:Uncharacterized protein n=1 Tax=Picea sitchensis TaxID=3332 RepID=A9NTT9_PICSI|nr:unknown [Picea sitchensis]